MSETSLRPFYRDPYWDCLKTALIFLVILGHVIKYHIGNNSIGMGIYNSLYIFHMPLFIFISGRFSQKKSNKRYIISIIKFLETYIVFQLIITLLTDCIISHNGFSWSKFLFTPEWAMWYLLALACWRLLIFAIPEKWLKDYPKLIIYILTGAYSYYYKPLFGVFGNFIASCVVYAMAIFLSVMFMRIIPINKRLAQWGRVTLVAYVFHPPLLIILNKMMMILSFHPRLPFLFILAVAITLFLFYISRFKLVKIIVNPFTYWKTTKK